MTFDDFWKLNSKRFHSENPWREELAREIWEAAQNNSRSHDEIQRNQFPDGMDTEIARLATIKKRLLK